jgi:nucleoside-diphosphate-sugar epimerase/uncharacterized iron-regulated protein
LTSEHSRGPDLSRERVLIAGCGYVGTALGQALAAAGHEVFALRRRPEGLPDSLHPVAADLSQPESLRGLPGGIDVVFYTAAAGGGGEAAYRAAYVDGVRHLLDSLAAHPPRRLLFTSSTGVYAQADGEWIDEESPTTPTHFSGRRLLEGEQLLAASGLDCVVLRLGGIYGPGRTRLVESVRRGSARIRRGPPAFTNRIHRDDCAGALAHLASLENPARVYLGVDDEPTDEAEVLRWLAERLGVPPPPPEEVDVEKDEVASAGGDDGTRRTRSNKRCRNARLLASGYRFRFPSFREGYDAVLRSMGLLLAMGLLALAPPARATDSKPPPPWQTRLHADHPLVGVVWDVAAGAPIAPDELARRLSRERFVLLGERHDQPDHHALQAWLVAALAARGRRPAVAFEMFDSSQEDALQRHLAASPRDAAGIGAAVGWERSGWPDWPLYRPIAEAALDASVPVVSANLGREETRALSRGGAAALDPALALRLGLAAPLPEAQRAAMEAEIVEGHCGHAPGHALGAMVEVQRARDAHMAAALRTAAAAHDGAVLIAGNGHLRRDHAVPARLLEQDPGARAVSVAILEVIPGVDDPGEYAGTPALYDYLWFTPRLDDEDACEKFKSALEGLKKR